jgi:hypothetical protein
MARYRLVPFVCLVSLAACVGSGDETVVILNNQVPGDGCVLTPDESGLSVQSGAIDYASGDFRAGYLFTPLVKNYATAADDSEARRHIAFVNGAHVTIHFVDEDLEAEYAGTDLARFEVPFSGRIDPAGVAQFGFELVPAALINAVKPSGAGTGTTPAESTLVLVDVSIFGTLNSGSFETQSYRFPVEICDRCLDRVIASCDALPQTFVPDNVGGVCNPYQDSITDCCSGTGGDVCPAVGTMTAVQ